MTTTTTPLNQIFKTIIPPEALYELLDKICVKYNSVYTFNTASYKKGIYIQEIPAFISKYTSYYYVSKQKYVTSSLTYKKMTTVIRQICNSNNIAYTSQILYDKSKYEIVYMITAAST